MHTPSECFGKSLRLRKRRDFLRAARQGSSAQTSTLKIQLRITRFDVGRVGFTVGKKVGNAVVRNRVKRRLREIIRKDRTLFARADMVVMALPGAATATFATLKADLYDAAKRARRRAEQTPKQRRPKKRRTAPGSPASKRKGDIDGRPRPAKVAPNTPGAEERS